MCLIENKGEEFIVVSIYCDRRQDIRHDVDLLTGLLHKYRGHNVIVGGDFNAHDPRGVTRNPMIEGG